MKVVIKDAGSFDVPRSQHDIPMNVLVRLKRDTGLTRAEFLDLVSEVDPDNPVDDELLGLGLIVWLAQRCKGVEGSLEELTKAPLDEVTFLREADDPEPGDSLVPPDPRPARADSGPGGRKAPTDRKKKTSSSKSASGLPASATTSPA